MVLPTVLALQTRYFQPILFYGITSYVVIYLLTIVALSFSECRARLWYSKPT
jgi:hypothetical protein